MPMAAAIKQTRSSLGMSQEKFAQHVTERGGDLKKGTLAAVEAGRRNMSEIAVERLADALDMHPRERARLHRARRKQAELDLEAATAARLEAFEQRLSELEERMTIYESIAAAESGYGHLTATGRTSDGEVVEFDSRMPHAAEPDEGDEVGQRSESPSEFTE